MQSISNKQYDLLREIVFYLSDEENQTLNNSKNLDNLEDKIKKFVECFFSDNYFDYKAPKQIRENISTNNKLLSENVLLKTLAKSSGIYIDDVDKTLMPSIEFKKLNTDSSFVEYGYYSRHFNSIALNNDFVSLVAQGKINLLEVINTIGHEFGHFLQYNLDLNEFSDSDLKKYFTNLYSDLNSNNEKDMFNFINRYLYLDEKDTNLMKEAFSLLENKSDFTKYFNYVLNIEDFGQYIESIKYSQYLNLKHENDARYRGLLFTSQFLNDVIQKAINNNDYDMENKISKYHPPLSSFDENPQHY